MMRNRVHLYGSVFYAYLLVGAQYDTFIFFPCKIDLERTFYQAGSHRVKGKKWTDKITGMTIYDGNELKNTLEETGVAAQTI